MAEILLSAFISIVFEKLASAALDKIGQSIGIHSELQKLGESLRKIRALLNDASHKEITNENVKDWLNRLQHLAYDIDDLLDALATDAIHRDLTQESETTTMVTKVRKLIPSASIASTVRMFFPRFMSSQVHDKLNDITTRLQELYDEKNNLGLTVKDKRSSQDINRTYQTSLLPPGIVGRDGEKEILLQKLLADHEPKVNQNNFSIVPIVGMGGIGKTTLARLLYNDKQVKDRFELKAWVCVSDEFDSFNISKVIFESVAGEEKKFTDPNLLHEALRNQLAGKRFLLVLDDVWTEKIEDWDTLVPPFHAAAPGSKIIITTRKEQLLQQLGYDNPYHLNKLSHDNALTLFAQHALGANNFDSYPMLRQHGEGIVHNCDGLPLALKALGSLLRTKTNEEKWKELSESHIWRLQDRVGILPALRLSYLDLSACLKQLFAYSCLFPKDYMFEKEDLILLWMAEGFLLESSTSKSMECLGEDYFDELLSRSFFQHVPNDESLFMMHDLMNDLATSVAGEFFIRLEIEMKDVGEQTLDKYRHMSFVRDKFMTCKKFKAFERANNLRTFLAVPVVVRNNWESFYLSNKILVDLLPQLPLLRVICLSKLDIDEIPASVGDLKHLRYLNLSRTQITHLPENVCNLYNLQTLIVFGCYNLSKLPESFLKLRKLRHLDIRDTRLLNNMPLGIGELKSLQTLSKIVIGGKNEFGISRVKNLKNLRQSLSIHGLDKLQNGDEAREANLSQMRLRKLKVEWSDVSNGFAKQTLAKEVLDVLKPHRDNLKNLEIRSYGGTEFPTWVGDSSFCKLTVVKMYKCRNCVFLPPLGQLPSLKELSIKNMGDVKEVGSELLGNGPAAFPSLEILRFEKMPRWEVWSVNAAGVAVFPCLKQLHIHNCPNMAAWEVWSANANVGVFPCLEELIVSKCPKLVKVSVEAIPSLRVLEVKRCGEGVLRSLVGVASSVTKLSIFNISGLSDEVWGGVVQSLGAVEELSIIGCNEIRNLWESLETCKALVNLNKLFIYICENLERLGGGEKEEEEGSNLFLTSLRILQIWLCKNLKHLSCPNNIETLDIENCENLEHLSCPANSIQVLKIWGCSSITSVSFPTGEGGGGGGWQKLKSIEIGECNSQVLEEELEKQVLKIINNDNTNMLLQVLNIRESQYLKSITKLNCLIQLTRLEIISCPMIIESFPDLQNLTSLKDLEIRNCPRMDGPPPLTSGVSGVWPSKLQSLTIGWLKRPISEWGPLPTSLVRLTLWGGFGSSSSSAEEEDVKSFSTSSSLLIRCSSLTTLWLRDFKKMERISSEGLQHLQHLHISNCPKLKHLPETLLPSLLSLRIYDCPNEELKEKASRGGSYWPLFSHIPQVDINRY